MEDIYGEEAFDTRMENHYGSEADILDITDELNALITSKELDSKSETRPAYEDKPGAESENSKTEDGPDADVRMDGDE